MLRQGPFLFSLLALLFWLAGCASISPEMTPALDAYVLDYDTPTNLGLQQKLEAIDQRLRTRYGMTPEHTAVGVLDLERLHLAMLHPDRIEYAASVPKIAILLAYFELRHTGSLDPQISHELGLMIKASSNEMATKFSRQLGLNEIQRVVDKYGFYDKSHGGGIWLGKHYGQSTERIGDPVANHSHAATVRQLLRFYLLLEQGKLVSSHASKLMKQIFASPEIAHDDIKFVKALKERNVQILRKWGSWENWFHDTAMITGPGRRYILVALTHHANGDDYLFDLARAVDELIVDGASPE